MRRRNLIFMAAAFGALLSCGNTEEAKPDIDSIISQMTLEEKVKLLVGTCTDPANPPYPAPGTMTSRPYWKGCEANTYRARNRVQGSAGESYSIEHLGIQSLVYADGPAGLRIDPIREAEPGKEFYCTAFPSAAVTAASWNTELAADVGKAMGNEVLEYGVDILLAPGMNIKRNPLTGRNFEYYSEDPLLSGEMAAAIVGGVQSQGVGACIKHFAVNNQETYRNGINAIVDEQTLREIYLRGFEIAVKKSSPWTIMSSYNKVNGEYASESHRLLRDILRDEWGFEGYVMTDWWGADDPIAQMEAGNNLLMPGTPSQIEEIIKAVENGTLAEDIIDRNLREILSTARKSPSFRGYEYSNAPDLKAHSKIAREAAAEGMVLLKNDKALPIKSGTRIALFGNYSYDTQVGGSGSGYVHRKYKINISDGMEKAGYHLHEDLAARYREHISAAKAQLPAENFWTIPIAPEMGINKEDIAQAVDQSDIAVITLGRMSGEGNDRHSGKGDYLLSDLEKALIEDVCEIFHEQAKKVVILLNMGDAIEFTGWNHLPDAILMTWLPGQEAGHAAADIISGHVNPSGKLPMTMAARYEDIPSSDNFGVSPGETNAVKYEEGMMVGYRYFTTHGIETGYPFGYGLSYTSFDYADLTCDKRENGEISISFKVKNTGDVPGKEVVQVYVHKPEIFGPRPVRELCAFHKTRILAPGETDQITISLSREDLKQWNPHDKCWAYPERGYEFHIGASSEDIRLNRSL